MKKIIFLLLAVFMLVGCEQVDESYESKIPMRYRVVIIDGCEYIESAYILTHKGNCKYCKIRREIEQDSLITKFKNQ